MHNVQKCNLWDARIALCCKKKSTMRLNLQCEAESTGLRVPPICNVFDLHEDFIVKFDEVFVF